MGGITPEACAALDEQIRGLRITSDNFLLKSVPGNNNGTSTYIKVRYSASSEQRTLLRFGLDTVPLGKTIASATLSLYYDTWDLFTATCFHRLYRLTRNDWHELWSNWNEFAGTGHSWTTPGGDVDGLDAITRAFTTTETGWITWDVTPIVQYAVDNTPEAVSFLLAEIAPFKGAVLIRSREHADVPTRPKLDIIYTS